MALQDTVDAADAVVVILNAVAVPAMPEAVTFARTFIPEFEADDLANLSEVAKGVVVPGGFESSPASRVTDTENHIIEVGLGRTLDNETTDIDAQLLMVESVIRRIRKPAHQVITLPGDGNTLQYIGTEVAAFFVPALLTKRIALSVVRFTYRGFN